MADLLEVFREAAEKKVSAIRSIVGRVVRIIDRRPCHKCGKGIWMIENKNGKTEPISGEFVSHWADCPKAAEFRRPRE